MQSNVRAGFDFDDWARLAQEDPAGFETRRRETVEAVIRQAPAATRQRLTRLQWRIDRLREQSGTPLKACLRLYGMMWDKVLGDDGLMAHIQSLGQGTPAAVHMGHKAQVLSFRRPDPGREG